MADGGELRNEVAADLAGPGREGRLLDASIDFTSLFDGSPYPMWVFDAETLAFLEVNAAALRHYGYAREELMRMTIKDIRPAADVPRLLDHLAQARGRLDATTWRHTKRDGTIVDVEVTSFKMRLAGRPAKLAIIRDVTEQRRMEAQNRHHAFLLSTITDAVIATDERFVLTGWNPAAETTYGWSAHEVLGRPVEILDEPGATSPEAMRQLVETGRFSGELVHVRRSGERVYVEVAAVAIADAAGHRIGYVSVNRDVTERRRNEGMIRALLSHVVSAQEEERRRVARELHDDAAQMLASLLVGLRTVEESPSLEEVRAAAVHLRGHVSRALQEVERIARGLRPAALDDLGLGAALERLGYEFARTFAIKVDVVIGDVGDRRLAPAVETTLYRIAQEALTNAGKYAAAAAVAIVVRCRDGRVQLIIEDDGLGFEPGTASSTRSLGLQGIRERAALVGGTVSVESSSGKGTAIYVSVPVGGRQ